MLLLLCAPAARRHLTIHLIDLAWLQTGTGELPPWQPSWSSSLSLLLIKERRRGQSVSRFFSLDSSISTSTTTTKTTLYKTIAGRRDRVRKHGWYKRERERAASVTGTGGSQQRSSHPLSLPPPVSSTYFLYQERIDDSLLLSSVSSSSFLFFVSPVFSSSLFYLVVLRISLCLPLVF